MTRFIPVEYLRKEYPAGIQCPIVEVAGHFDKKSISPSREYSLHTEYSYYRREFDSERISRYPELLSSQKKGIPQLWKSNTWADEFADFIIGLVGMHPPPKIIEIHPPFIDYCPDLFTFMVRYTRFETIIHRAFPDALICIENRAGTQYRGEFLVSSIASIVQLLESIQRNQVRLNVVLDYPQIFTAEDFRLDRFPLVAFEEMHATLQPHKHLISGLHIWGRKGYLAAHCGDLNGLFSGDTVMKNRFLKSILAFYDDGRERYFVPEVNSSTSDLQSIVNDFIACGAEFSVSSVL